MNLLTEKIEELILHLDKHALPIRRYARESLKLDEFDSRVLSDIESIDGLWNHLRLLPFRWCSRDPLRYTVSPEQNGPDCYLIARVRGDDALHSQGRYSIPLPLWEMLAASSDPREGVGSHHTILKRGIDLAERVHRAVLAVNDMISLQRDLTAREALQSRAVEKRGVSDPIPDEASTRNVIARDGAIWRLTYDSISADPAPPDRLGWHYLKVLLASPYKDVWAEDLRAFVNNIDFKASLGVDQRDDGEVESEDVSQREAPAAMNSEKTRTQLTKRLAAIDQESEKALHDDRLDEAQRLDDERAGIEEYLKKATSKSGRSRTFRSERSSARDSVSNAIRRAIKLIESSHPSLFKHLSKSLEYGVKVRYNPQEPTYWAT